MSAHVLLNLLNELREKIKSLFRNEFDKFNNTGKCIFDSSLKSHFLNLIFIVKTFKILPYKRCYGRHYITLLNM